MLNRITGPLGQLRIPDLRSSRERLDDHLHDFVDVMDELVFEGEPRYDEVVERYVRLRESMAEVAVQKLREVVTKYPVFQ